MTVPVKFVVLCQPRSGGALLNAALSTHPDVHMPIDEPFGAYKSLAKQTRPKPFLNELYESDRPERAAGFRLLDYQPIHPSGEGLRTTLASIPDLKVVSLVRLNFLARTISTVSARKLDRWHDIAEEARPYHLPTFDLDLDILKWEAHALHSGYQLRKPIMRGKDCFHVCYEDLDTFWTQITLDLQEFLGVEPRELPRDHFRRTSGKLPLSYQVANWEQAIEANFAMFNDSPE